MAASNTRAPLPRPRSGDGQILMTSGDGEVVLVWEKGQLTRAHLASDESAVMDATTLKESTSAGISPCECCKRTDGGVRVCHAIPCGSICE